MPVALGGFAHALCRTDEFEGVDPEELDAVLAGASEPLNLRMVGEGPETPLVKSGAPFTHAIFVQEGVVVPWQHPHSELRYPFFVGSYEILMGASRWMATYSATKDSVVVELPVSVMNMIIAKLPKVRENMLRLVLLRVVRYYWTSLSSTGKPVSRVAAALVSRLAIHEDDIGTDKEIRIQQIELMRLTVLSRTAVASGLRELEDLGVIRSDGQGARHYFSGRITVPNINALKDIAFAHVQSVIAQSLAAGVS